ncbi:MAG: hypothetical protein Q7R41_04950, partial [Phycisphaerales bacterium]|nr:hypothetical protein [Phycisphaerales bacterium]
QRECGISGPTFSVGPKTKDCADRLAQQIVNERASGGGGGGAGAIRLPSATIVGDLAQEYCEGTSGTVVFRDSAFFLDCSNFNTFELRPDVTTCNPASADANAPLVCTEWDVVQVSGASSSFCDSGFGTFVCYVFPAVVGAVAVTAGTIWVGTETGAIHGTIKDGGTP